MFRVQNELAIDRRLNVWWLMIISSPPLPLRVLYPFLTDHHRLTSVSPLSSEIHQFTNSPLSRTMFKRTTFTTLTALPEGITRATVLETLHSHTEMIDLNPLVEERHPCKPPPNADPEEAVHCQWYSMTDKINYLPGGLASGHVTFFCCFNDLTTGVQTHCYAPLGLDIRGKWTLGGSLPGEPKEPVELGLGVPKNGLWLREDVDMRCNVFATKFVKKNLKSAHATLVDRLIEKAHLAERNAYNHRLSIAKSTLANRSTSNSDYHGEAPSYADSRSSKSMSPFHSPNLPYVQTEPAAPPYPYHGVDPAYTEANPYDRANTHKGANPYEYSNPYDRTSGQSYHPMELPVRQSPTNQTQSFGAVELPVYEVAPLRIQKTSPRTSPQLPSRQSPPPPPIPARVSGGSRPFQPQR